MLLEEAHTDWVPGTMKTLIALLSGSVISNKQLDIKYIEKISYIQLSYGLAIANIPNYKHRHDFFINGTVTVPVLLWCYD